MDKKEKSTIKKMFSIFSKGIFIVGVVVVFYRLPSVVAEKISYRQLKNRKINQNLTEEEE